MSALKKNETDKVKTLEYEIKKLDSLDPVGNFEIIKEKQVELNKIREKRLEGTMVRAKARWIENGEKPTNYFCNLENRNFVSKRMVSLSRDDGTEINNFDSINNEVGNFYKKLYSSRESEIVDVEIDNILTEDTPRLSDNVANLIEGPITPDEASLFLSKMKDNKSPGSSGFTVEFFKFFLERFKVFLG